MKKKLIVISIPILFLLISACQYQEKKQDAEQLENNIIDSTFTLKEKVEFINRVLNDAILKSDYETLLKYYTNDVVVSADFHPSIRGKEAIKDIYEKNKKNELTYHSFSGTVEDVWECENYIYERGKFGLTVSSKDHQKPLGYHGSYFTIWQKENDNMLRIKYVIWNFDFNPCE